MFRTRGFEVIDYQTSRQAFNEGGLPLEDTKSSRDKYADLAPYGTATSFLFATRSDHIAVATLQIFLADKMTSSPASMRRGDTAG
jgi:hypothetical protein